MKLRDKVFAITGANRGIGLATSEMAAKQGSRLILICRNQDEALIQHLKSLGAQSVEILRCDLSSPIAVKELGKHLASISVDLLFNNAGVLTGGLLENQTESEIEDLIQVNISAVIFLTRAVLPGMIKRKNGLIIFNSSVSAYMHFPCASTYAASKAALVAFSNCLEAELSDTGVKTLTLITPGIKTRMFDDIENKYRKNFDVPQGSISPAMYAKQIEAAIEDGKTELLPNGLTAFGLWTARYQNWAFKRAIKKKLKRI